MSISIGAKLVSPLWNKAKPGSTELAHTFAGQASTFTAPPPPPKWVCTLQCVEV